MCLALTLAPLRVTWFRNLVCRVGRKRTQRKEKPGFGPIHLERKFQRGLQSQSLCVSLHCYSSKSFLPKKILRTANRGQCLENWLWPLTPALSPSRDRILLSR